ncbi:ABC transporter substrate-binding protein [Chloroflexus aurantiacus]|nr:MAG: hypothetical protein KatS3mg023_4029 [Armatimonadota bacterium]GIV93218.1 MAG: hypothetical protein KatS3mg056_1927 [Chloroflexus sp.]
MDTQHIATDTWRIDHLARHAPATDDLPELATWLQCNGAAHLSPIERIELAERLITRRRFLIGAGVLALGMISGCGSGAPASIPTATVAATRTVRHAYGTTDVPLNPQRVIALDAFFTLTPLVELGVPVIGSVSLGSPAVYPGLSAQESANIVSVGNGRLGSLETVAALKPDLIIGIDFVEPPYEELSQIAPTVIIPTALDWKEQHRALGEATGTYERAERGIAAYEERVALLRSRIPDLTVSYLSLIGETPLLYLQGPKAWAPARILADVGVQRPADEIVSDDTFFKALSLEVLPELKGDVLLYSADYPGISPEEISSVRSLLANPIWQQIPAVRAGRAFQVTGAHWETFGGLRSAQGVLDDIERLLLPLA